MIVIEIFFSCLNEFFYHLTDIIAQFWSSLLLGFSS